MTFGAKGGEGRIDVTQDGGCEKAQLFGARRTRLSINSR